MTTNLPEGLRIHRLRGNDPQFILEARIGVPVNETFYEKGLRFSDDQLASRDKAIARAAFEAARIGNWIIGAKIYFYKSADDYLASPEYKTLTGRG